MIDKIPDICGSMHPHSWWSDLAWHSRRHFEIE